MSFQQKIITTGAPASVILIRFVVGVVFLSEGIRRARRFLERKRCLKISESI